MGTTFELTHEEREDLLEGLRAVLEDLGEARASTRNPLVERALADRVDRLRGLYDRLEDGL